MFVPNIDVKWLGQSIAVGVSAKRIQGIERNGLNLSRSRGTRPCEQGNWDTWLVLDPWNQV